MTFNSSSEVNSAMYVSLNCTSAGEVPVIVGYGASSVDDWRQTF
jgi:hypothetical protein